MTTTEITRYMDADDLDGILKYENLENISSNDIPDIIGKSVDLMKNLEDQINKSNDSAENAYKKALAASKEKACIINQKNAIKAVQSSGLNTAEAVVNVVEAVKGSFQLHRQFAEITKYLFVLGAGSIGLNRTVVRQLEAKLKGASEEKISELVKMEIMSVIRQLKAQEDMMSKQEKMNDILKEHGGKIKEIVKTYEQLQYETDKRFDDEYKRHDEELKARVETDEQLKNELQKQGEKVKELFKQVEENSIRFKKKLIFAYSAVSVVFLIEICFILIFLMNIRL